MKSSSPNKTHPELHFSNSVRIPTNHATGQGFYFYVLQEILPPPKLRQKASSPPRLPRVLAALFHLKCEVISSMTRSSRAAEPHLLCLRGGGSWQTRKMLSGLYANNVEGWENLTSVVVKFSSTRHLPL